MAQVRAAYISLIQSGVLREDARQAEIIGKLDALYLALEAERRRARSLWRRLTGRGRADYRSVKGIYLYGEVGRGKTMLMDLFYAALPAGDKKRIHFSDFMNNVQNRLAAARKAAAGADIIAQAADDLAGEAHILCLDEFSVNDIADAMILARLFQALFARGAVLVASSNAAPQDLYKNGLNRALFLPFIALLEEKAEICHLQAPRDYRLEQGESAPQPLYLAPCGEEAEAQINIFWQSVTGQQGGAPQQILVRGRKVDVPCAAPIKPEMRRQFAAAAAVPYAARFDFADICGRNLAAFDYAALAAHYALFCVENVPLFNENNRDEARRFIAFIDIIYDRRLPLCLSAAAAPQNLYTGQAAFPEKFEFARTASRLAEMQSEAYFRGEA